MLTPCKCRDALSAVSDGHGGRFIRSFVKLIFIVCSVRAGHNARHWGL